IIFCYRICHSPLFLIPPRHPRPPLFPYTTLFRSTICPPNSTTCVDTLYHHSPPRRHPKKPSTGALIGIVVSALIVLIGLASVERSEEHTSELQSLRHLVCRLLLEKKNKITKKHNI